MIAWIKSVILSIATSLVVIFMRLDEDDASDPS